MLLTSPERADVTRLLKHARAFHVQINKPAD